MATSSSRNFILTRDTIINAALRKLKVVSQGDTATSTQLTEGAEALNAMVQSWQAEGIALWTFSTFTQSLTAGYYRYDINTEPDILAIDRAVIRESVTNTDIIYPANPGYDYPVEIITAENLWEIADRTSTTGRPTKMWCNFQLNKLTIDVYPCPDQAYSLVCRKVIRLQDFDSASNNPDFPVWWSDALIYGLAYRLSPEYSIPLQERAVLKQEADTAKILAKMGSVETGSLRISPYVRSD